MRREARRVIEATERRDGKALREAVADLRAVLDSGMELGGPLEIGERFGVSRVTVWNWSQRDDFPAPVARLARGAVYDMREVQAWHDGRAS